MSYTGRLKTIQDVAKTPYNLAQTDSWKLFKVMAEFVEGYDLMSKYKNEVTIFGSARTHENDEYYIKARKLGEMLGLNNFTVITGGGPGIMEAANRGAFQVKGISIGLGIELPMEQRINPYVTDSVDFSYFFTRKVMLTTPSQAFVYFPGGYGTLDELFQVLNEIALGFIQKVPVILVGVAFWSPLVSFLKDTCHQILGAIKSEDLEMIKVVETAEAAYDIIQKTEDHPNFLDNISNTTNSVSSVNWRIFRIMAELVEGLDFLQSLPKNITILGSNKVSRDSSYYQDIYHIAQESIKHDFSLLTGGGFGIAEAANKASAEAGKSAYATLLNQAGKTMNEYVSDSIHFRFPFTRQFILTGPTNQYLFCPGGLGTLHQLFEVLTLVQTHKVA
ncbi:MAG: TIGR00730 family Rossman fold protein, partial [Candidatus Paceibacterota bacterium]